MTRLRSALRRSHRRSRASRSGARGRGLACVATIGATVCAAFASGSCVDTGAAAERARVEALVAERTGVDPPGGIEDDAWARSLLDGGLTEDEAVALAVRRNPQVRGVLARVDAAKAEAAQARLPANPSVAGTLLFPSIGGPEKKTASILLPLADLWLLPDRAAVADAALESEIVDAARVAVDVAASTRVAVRRALGWRRALEVARDLEAAGARSAEATALRARSGEVSDLEAATAREPGLAASLLTAETERELTLARLEVARWVGSPADPRAGDVRDDGGGGDDVPEAAADAVAAAWDRRLEARVAELRLIAAEAAVDRERGRVFRDLRVGFSWERLLTTLRGYAASLELPLFDRNQAQIALAEARAEEARCERDRVRQQIEYEVAVAIAARDAARRRTGLLRDVAVPNADAVVAGARRRQDAGDEALDLLLQAERTRFERLRDLVRAQVDEAVADAELLRAVGGPGGRSAGARAAAATDEASDASAAQRASLGDEAEAAAGHVDGLHQEALP